MMFENCLQEIGESVALNLNVWTGRRMLKLTYFVMIVPVHLPSECAHLLHH